jgi:alkaline phosphatase
MSTETLASCAETKQAGVAKTTAAIKTRFIMRQIRAPLVQHHYKSGRSVTRLIADGNGRSTIRSRSRMGTPPRTLGELPNTRCDFGVWDESS